MRMRIRTGYVVREGTLTNCSGEGGSLPIPLVDTSRRKACSVAIQDEPASFDPPRLEAPPTAAQPLLPPPSTGGYMPPPSPGMLPPPSSAPPFAGVDNAFALQDGPPTATVVPTGTVGKRSRGKVVGGVIAVVAMLAAGGFAV